MLIAMDSPEESPTISSFVIRFVVDPGTDAYRGEVRHIQSSEEVHFHSWDEAVAFIRRYVPIEVESGK